MGSCKVLYPTLYHVTRDRRSAVSCFSYSGSWRAWVRLCSTFLRRRAFISRVSGGAVRERGGSRGRPMGSLKSGLQAKSGVVRCNMVYTVQQLMGWPRRRYSVR